MAAVAAPLAAGLGLVALAGALVHWRRRSRWREANHPGSSPNAGPGGAGCAAPPGAVTGDYETSRHHWDGSDDSWMRPAWSL
jgi:hypothetical protein